MQTIELVRMVRGTAENRYSTAEQQERTALSNNIRQSLAARLQRDSTPVLRTVGEVSILENQDEGDLCFNIAYPHPPEVVTYRLTSNTIRKEGFLTDAKGDEVYFSDLAFSNGDSDERVKPSLAVGTQELRHLEAFINNPDENLAELIGLDRLPRHIEEVKPVFKTFPTISEEGPSSVVEFPLFVPGLRQVYALKSQRGFNSTSLDKGYFKANPKARAALRRAIDYFKTHDSELLLHISDLDQICGLLGVKTPIEIMPLLTGSKGVDLSNRINRKVAKSFGFGHETSAEITTALIKNAKAADTIILSDLRSGALEPLSQDIDMREEVKSTHDISNLLYLMFTHPAPQVRFEAKRKLIFIKLIAEMDKRIRDIKAHEAIKVQRTLRQRRSSKDNAGSLQEVKDPATAFILEHVFTTHDGKDTEMVVLVTKQDLHDFHCTEVEVRPIGELDAIRERIARHKPRQKKFYLKYTPLQRRFFEFDGRLIPVSFTSRPEKDFRKAVLKLFRKGKYNPEAGVPDMKGLRFIVQNRDDAIAFKRKLELAGVDLKDSSQFIPEDTEDTTTGKEFSAENKGSSKDLRIIKYDVMVEGVRTEIQILLIEDLIDLYNKDQIAYEDYELNRLLDSGAFEALFPTPIYEKIGPQDIENILKNQRDSRRKRDQLRLS